MSASRRKLRLGELQLRILKVLWARGSASVAEVRDALGPDAVLAYTTVATMLQKMEVRGLVRHEVAGRRFLYEAAVTADAVTGTLVGDLLDRLFEGRLADMVSHLLETRDVTPEELARLQQLIAKKKRQT